jgi:hypothetical protein
VMAARRLERKKLGVQLDPPALLLLYAESGVNKKRTMPIRYKLVCSGSLTTGLRILLCSLLSFYDFFCLLLTVGTFKSVFKDKKLLSSHRTVEIKGFIVFCLHSFKSRVANVEPYLTMFGEIYSESLYLWFFKKHLSRKTRSFFQLKIVRYSMVSPKRPGFGSA